MCEVAHMARYTKTQKKRLVMAIQTKAMTCFSLGILSMADANAIKKITDRAFNKLK